MRNIKYSRKVLSGTIILILVLSTILAILPLRMPKAGAYTMPPGVFWNMDDLVLGSGGAVSGPPGGPYIFHDSVVIPLTSTLNIGPGDICLFDGFFRIEVDGTLNAIGIAMNRITMISNSITPAPGDWDGIQFNSGSDPSSSIRYADLSYGHSIKCFSSSPSIINNDISSFSFWAIGGWNTASPIIDNNDIHNNGFGMHFWDTGSPIITGNTIDNNTGPGIQYQFMGSPLLSSIVSNNNISSNGLHGILVEASGPILPVMIDNNNIWNNTDNGIRISSGSATIANNNIFGRDAPSGSFDSGDNGIFVHGGISDMVTITENNITGGDGDEYNLMTLPDGGRAISVESFEGVLYITDNHLIQGGNGGENPMDGGRAGKGGDAIYINPISNLPNTVEISGNSMIKGGRGGDNNAMMDGNAGVGGVGLNITDNDDNGALFISNNMNILGGDGGDNHANWANGWKTGDGGNAISLYNCRFPCYTEISQNSNVRGGKGGDTIGSGFLTFPLPSAGNGGSGIYLISSSNINISQSSITGGDGGNNTFIAFDTAPGNGGHGVVLTSATIIGSNATIASSKLTGGEGGDNWVMIPGGGLNGQGGMALYSIQSTGSVDNSGLTGGMGGENHGPSSMGGPGGSGFFGYGAYNMNLDGIDIIGGKAGENFHPEGMGGNNWLLFQGKAVYMSNCDNIRIANSDVIIGGDGGDDSIGNGPGGASTETILVETSSNIDIIGSNITTGVGGLNASSGEYGLNGTRCLYLWDLGGVNNIIGNDITTHNRDDLTDGIYCSWFAPSGSINIADNFIYENYQGISLENIDIATIGDNNRIFDNYYGIRLSQVDASIGTGNIIRDNDYGIDCWISNPTIKGDQVLDSLRYGLHFDGGSDAIVQRTSIINSLMSNVWCDGGSSPEFYNCTVSSSNPLTLDFYVMGDSHPWLLNTTFDKSKTDYGDVQSNLTVNWYMHAKVVDIDNMGVGGATLWVNDSFGTPHPGAPFSTSPTGWVRWLVVTEYVENISNGNRVYHTPHNASATKGLSFGYTVANMSLSRVVIIVLDGMSYQFPLEKGWNMISVPINQSDTSFKKVLEYIQGKYRTVLCYNASDANDPWKNHHVPKVGTPLEDCNDLHNIDRTMGFWIYMEKNDVLSLVGRVPIPTTTTIKLKKGWNLVGYPSLTQRYPGQPAFLPAECNLVLFYNATSSMWEDYDPGSGSGTILNMNPGNGFWVHVKSDCTWSVDW